MLSKTRNVIQIMIVIALRHYIRLIYRKDCFRMMKYNRFRNETLVNNPYRYQETKTIDMLNFIYLCFKMLLDQKNYIYSKDLRVIGDVTITEKKRIVPITNIGIYVVSHCHSLFRSFNKQIYFTSLHRCILKYKELSTFII